MEVDCQSNDPAGRRTELFNRYVLPHRNLIYKLCIKYSYFSADVEDNYNETLVNFFRYIESYDPTRSIQPWLHTVTKRFIHDLNMRGNAFKRSDDTDPADIIDLAGEEAEYGGNRMGMDNYRLFYGDGILDALSRLKPIYREALLLQQAGYSLNEIMEISCRKGNLKTKNIETVKSRLFLAKKQMRQMITRDGEKRNEYR